MTAEPTLSIRELSVQFATPDGVVNALNGVSLDVFPGETLGLVGETGSGKSLTALAALALIAQPPGKITEGSIHFDGRDLLQASKRQLRKIRGRDISLIFQDPLTALNPVMKVGVQITETLRAHDSMSRRSAMERAGELLRIVGIPDPLRRIDQYPHELSGGMRQRVVIAIAMANRPKLIIADEPTTALDVTIQAQILEVLRGAQHRSDAAMILVSHDLGVMAERADRIAVMYAGRIVEVADVKSLFRSPAHPYTLGLLRSVPRVDRDMRDLNPIPGAPPNPINLPSGCPFHPRCSISKGRDVCRRVDPPLEPVSQPGSEHDVFEHVAACHFSHEVPGVSNPTAPIRPDKGRG